MKYFFKSDRLGFRTWQDDDLHHLRAMNSDPDVMRYFPSILTEAENMALLDKLEQRYIHDGYTYYAVEELGTREFIGFIGIAYQTFDSPYTPCVDIGWRLLKKHWGKGFATEGAKRVLDYANTELRIKEIRAFAPAINLPSISVMKKIGMSYLGVFNHSLLSGYPDIESCVVYNIILD